MPLHFIKSLLDRLGRREQPRKINRRADPVGAFLAERTQARSEAATPAATLYEAYQRWARIHGAPLLSPQHLGVRVSRLGYRKLAVACASGGARVCWLGLDLIEVQP